MNQGSARPGRVALVVGAATGGMARHVRMLAAGLTASGVLVCVHGPSFGALEIGSRPRLADARVVLRLRRLLAGDTDARVPDAAVPDAAAPDVELPGAAVPDVGLPGAAVPDVGAPDVVHAHGMRAGALCALALAGKRGVRPALVVTVHNAPPPGRGLPALMYRVLERIVALRADLLLCVSPDLEDRIRRAGARNVARAVVPAPAAAQPAHAVEPVPGLPVTSAAGRRPVVLGVGRLAAQKGFGTLLAAAASWRDMDPLPRVVIAGDGPLLADLLDRAATLGVDAEFLGHRDDVPALLAAADVVVVPSRWEGQPLVVQEALQAGAAIVATRVGGVPDMAGPDAAYLVTPEDAAQLAAGVRAVLTSQSLAARLRSAALQRATTLPTEQDAVTAALAAYQKVARA